MVKQLKSMRIMVPPIQVNSSPQQGNTGGVALRRHDLSTI
ncbi:hypothetical protein GAPWKB11_0529 [Gilliamella apicola]|jgi:hypothetical protein|nr:hypothetical protein GAPWKB11_0529 [Gilliamella apicola]